MSRTDKFSLYTSHDGTERQPQLCSDEHISFKMVASVNARTLPLVLLQSNHVYLAVGDACKQHDADCVTKMNHPSAIDINFQQLLIYLAQLHRMLVSVSAVF